MFEDKNLKYRLEEAERKLRHLQQDFDRLILALEAKKEVIVNTSWFLPSRYETYKINVLENVRMIEDYLGIQQTGVETKPSRYVKKPKKKDS